MEDLLTPSENRTAARTTVAETAALMQTTEKGIVRQTIDNCLIALKNDPVLTGKFRKNELSGKIDIVGDPGWKRTGSAVTDTDMFQLQYYLEKNYGLSNDRNILKAVNIAASENSFHPIRDALSSLCWDHVPRMDTLLCKYLGAENSCYTREVTRLLMTAAIRRIFEPGCKFELMVCLVGGQGIGKSTFFRFLAMKDEWFSDDLRRLDDDNIYRKMQGHWIIEMSEMMATVNAKSIEEIKSFLSRQKETYKVPYETHPEDRPRQCIFVGTTNSMDFLPLDRTGNRRFAPVLAHPENVAKHILEDEAEARAYILQAWAEAYFYYQASPNCELKLSKETEALLRDMQKQFMPEDTRIGIIEDFLQSGARSHVCSIMLYREAFHHDYDEPKRWELKEISAVMNSMPGWEPVSSFRFEKYGTQRAWKRVLTPIATDPANTSVNARGFASVPEDEELPFH